MSDQNLLQFDLDLTGLSPLNLVTDDAYSLNKQKNIALAPRHGAFFVNSLEIKHLESGYILRKNIDFKVLQPFETLSNATGKSVAGLILIHNSIIHQNIVLSYQAVGGNFSTDSSSLENYLNKISDDNPSYSWYNIMVEDETINEELTKMDRFDFHFLCYTLEKIRNTILWSDSTYYDRLRKFLEAVLDSISVQTKLSLDSFLDEAFGSFKADINKALIGLSNLENLESATTADINEIIEYDSRIIQFEKNKYITLRALNTFKELVYERFAIVSQTNIGAERGMSLSPSMVNVINMLNGSVFILESKKTYTEKNIIYDDNVYPPSTAIGDSFSVLKLNNNIDNRGGLYFFSERSGKKLFIAHHSNGDPTMDFTWRELTTEKNTEDLSNLIGSHILRTDNPHVETKSNVGFPKLENLSVVTSNDIMCLKACRKYVTMDAMMLFMKTYLVSPEAAAEDPRNDDVEKVQIIYTAQAEPRCLPAPCPCPEVEAPPVVELVPYPLVVKVSQQYELLPPVVDPD